MCESTVVFEKDENLLSTVCFICYSEGFYKSDRDVNSYLDK